MPERDVILVVDDEPDIRDALQALLEGVQGCEVLLASSGPQAIATVEALGPRLRMIVSDYRMPEMDGLELLSYVARVRPDVPRVLVTAYADTQLAVDALNKARVSRFVSKPIDPAPMEAMVRELLAAELAARQRQAAFRRSTGAAGDTKASKDAP